MDAFPALVAAASLVAGAIASVAGFGVGSVLTPLLGAALGLKLAVAAAPIPHLLGAALQSIASSLALSVLFATLLLFAGVGSITGYSERLRFGRREALIGGALSGFLGGLVGNQGGIRSAAMLGFDVPRSAFVATSTAVALLVDGVRVPIYVVTQGEALLPIASFSRSRRSR